MLDGFGEFRNGPVRVSVLDAVPDAVVEMPLQHHLSHPVQGGFCRVYLLQNILVHHSVNGLHLPKAQVISALQAAGLDERSRPEQLTLENYCALQTALANT